MSNNILKSGIAVTLFIAGLAYTSASAPTDVGSLHKQGIVSSCDVTVISTADHLHVLYIVNHVDYSPVGLHEPIYQLAKMHFGWPPLSNEEDWSYSSVRLPTIRGPPTKSNS